jgi:hypothetical protein
MAASKWSLSNCFLIGSKSRRCNQATNQIKASRLARPGPRFDLRFICIQALATAKSLKSVVYAGVRRSCFMDHVRRSPATPALAMVTVPLP